MNAVCGVDISKEWLDAYAASSGAYQRFANSAEGIAGLAAFCRDAGVELVAMEASGHYEQLAFLTLWQLGLPCAITNARAVRDFARAMGLLEKTDRIDAEVIARFAIAKPLAPTPPPSQNQRKMNALVARMRQVTSDLTIQKQRLSSLGEGFARDQIVELIALLKRQSKALVADIASLVAADPLWTALDQAFRSVKGVADKTVAFMFADLPEIGLYPNKSIAKLAGLAPLADDSGKRQGKRSIRGGRAGVRSILYLVADVARKFDPSLQDFKDRLLAQGKPKMVVRVALARKLLVRLNAKARDARYNLANAT
jgi:transposase